MTDAMRRSGTVSAHHWGPGIIKTEAGRVTSVEPHPDDPHPSALNRNLAASLNGGAPGPAPRGQEILFGE